MKGNWAALVGIVVAAALTALSVVVGLQTSRMGALETRITSLESGLRSDIRALNTRIDVFIVKGVSGGN